MTGRDEGQRERRRMRSDLANAGWGLLVGSTILLGVVALFGIQYGWGILLGSAVGGALGLGFAIRFPGNPAGVGYVFARLPRQLSPYEERLRTQLVSRRRQGQVVLIGVAYLAGFAAFGAWGAQAQPGIDVGTQATSGFVGACQAASLAWAIQYLQVLRALSRDDRDDR